MLKLSELRFFVLLDVDRTLLKSSRQLNEDLIKALKQLQINEITLITKMDTDDLQLKISNGTEHISRYDLIEKLKAEKITVNKVIIPADCIKVDSATGAQVETGYHWQNYLKPLFEQHASGKITLDDLEKLSSAAAALLAPDSLLSGYLIVNNHSQEVFKASSSGTAIKGPMFKKLYKELSTSPAIAQSFYFADDDYLELQAVAQEFTAKEIIIPNVAECTNESDVQHYFQEKFSNLTTRLICRYYEKRAADGKVLTYNPKHQGHLETQQAYVLSLSAALRLHVIAQISSALEDSKKHSEEEKSSSDHHFTTHLNHLSAILHDYKGPFTVTQCANAIELVHKSQILLKNPADIPLTKQASVLKHKIEQYCSQLTKDDDRKCQIC